MLLLHVKHDLLNQRFFECRFPEESTVADVKDRVYRMTGTMPPHQELTLVRGEGDRVRLANEAATLLEYGAQTGMELFVVDTNPFSLAKDQGLTDVSKIEKYVLSEEEYNRREGTVRQFIIERFHKDPEFRKQVLERQRLRREEIRREFKALEIMDLGMRCQLSGDRRGEIAYIGEVPTLGSGPYVGVKLDEPFGDSDGSHGGFKYFECGKNYGIFVKPTKMLVGDFPERDDLESSESEL